MSSPIVVPFNFEPVATTVRSTNYTIPAGRYARVTPLRLPDSTNVHQSATNANMTVTRRSLTLNSNDFFIYKNSGTLSNSTSSTYTITLVAPSLVDIDVIAITSPSYRLDFDGVNAYPGGSITAASVVFRAMYCRTIAVVATAGSIACRFSTIEENNTYSPFFVKAGDIIGVTSAGRFLTEEYNQIT